MGIVNEILQWVQQITFLLVGVWAFLRWRRRGDDQSRWLAATFVSLGLTVLLAVVVEPLGDGIVATVLGKFTLVLLLPFPYYLLRFGGTFEPVNRRFRQVTLAAVGASIVLGMWLPTGSDAAAEDAGRGPVELAVVLLVVGTWLVVLPFVAQRFWRAGSGQPTLVRRRLRTLSFATASLSIAMLFAGFGAGEDSAITVVIEVAAVVSALAFLIGFAPPAVLKTYWRRAEEAELHHASVRLMGATRPDQVAELLVPHLQRVIAAQGAALVDDGEVLSSSGATEGQLERAVAGRTERSMRFDLANGVIHLWTNSYTPFFGQEELDLLERLAVLADLALDRTGLLEREQQARVDLEAANAELESFIYTASHDLKSPLIAMLSYTDVLEEEYGDTLAEEGAWYLGRMRANGRYMEALVGDLLELSRVGRIETATAPVDLGRVARDLATEVEQQLDGAHVQVGDLPTVEMNDLRATQLLRNLIDNAAVHGGEEQTIVEVDSRPSATHPGAVEVLVRDNGAGVPEEYRERIFGVFERLAADNEEGTGTGIGLAICRKIMESLEGDIWVTDHEGGAEFALLFPAATVVHTASPIEQPEEIVG